MTTNNTDWNSLLDTVKDLSESYLRSFAADPAFDDKMILAFGKTSSKLGADWLASQVALPDIEVSSVESLNGAYGAFSPDTGKIYLSEELLESNFQALIAAVFLEEYGHFIDAQLNTEDFPGDEGAIFSSLVRGKELSIDRLQQLKTENDRSVAVVGEDFIEIEQATVSDSGGFEGSQQTLQLESNGGGIAEYEFEFYFIPDQFIIRYEGQELVNTGFIGGSRSGQVEIPEGNSDKLEVIVATNDEGTAWDYTVNTSAKGINIEDAEVEVEGGSNSRATISFTVTLSEASSVETTVRYFTLVGTAVDGITGSDRPDYRPVTGTLTFAPGQTTKDIEITVLGDTPVNYGSDANFEIFARDIAYRDWTGKEEQDIDDGSNLYGDLGYRVDQFFNDPSTGFQAVGLNSDEKFFVLISDPTNAEIFRDSQGERERLLTELADALGGDTNSSAYVQALEEIDKLQSEDASWTFATGTIYDSGKDPVLAIRGTEPDQLSTDVFDDANPSGIGFAQFTQNSSSVSEWLQAVSNPEDTTFSFEPHITGHSLGGALTQWFASDYSRFGDLGDIVTFNAPGISDSRANSFNAGKAGDVTHYITSNDIVSMAGNEYISGGYVLSNQDEVPSTFPNPLNAHLHPVIISTIALSGLNRPTGLTSDAIKPSSILSDDFFTYLPDVDYFAIQLIIAGLGAGLGTIVPGATVGGAYVASALSARITTEANRALIGAVIYSIDYALEFASEVIQAALNAAIRWGTVAFDAISQWGEDAWNAVSNWTNDAWNATEQWVNDAWSATTQWTSDAWNATTQWTSDAWNATTQWTSDAWSATTQWTSDAWSATSQWTGDAWDATAQWTGDAWDATEQWTAKAWEATANWTGNLLPFSLSLQTFAVQASTLESVVAQAEISNPWEATTFWTPAAWEATTQWSDAAWDATRQWSLDLWQATTAWTDESWEATTQWTDDFWQATAQVDIASGDQILFGTSGDDVLTGGIGNDIIDGGDGNDALNGAEGNDYIRGGNGNDNLTGGSGEDSFAINDLSEGVDAISDFDSGVDRIVVPDSFGNDLTPNAVIDESQFILGATASDSDDRFIYDSVTGNLFFDLDGTGDAPQQQIAILTSAPNLSASDIFVGGSSTTPTIKITEPSTEVSGAEVTIEWNAFDPDSEAQISLFYDTDNQGLDGFLIADSLIEIDGAGSFIWNTENVPQGNYFIYAIIVDEDGLSASSYSKGQVNLLPSEEADLSITKTARSESIGLGKNLTYTIEVKNNSSVTSQRVNLLETLPEIVTLISSTIIPSDEIENIFTFDLGDMASGEIKTIEFTVGSPVFAETIVSTSVVTSATFDPDLANNVVSLSTDVTAPELPDLAVTRTDSSETVELREEYTYTLTVANNGSAPATNVTLIEDLPSGVNFISSDTNFFDSGNGTLRANLGNLSSAEEVTVSLTVSSSTSGNLIGTTTVSSNETDRNPLDNLNISRQIVSSIAPANADLELTQTVDNLNPSLGEQVTLTLVVNNSGPGTATGIRVKSLLPTGLTFIAGFPEQGSYDETTGIWDVGNIRDNLERTLTINALVEEAIPLTIDAEVIAVNESDVDSTPNNNDPDEDDQVSVTLNVASIAPSLAKVSDDVFTLAGTAPKLKVSFVASESTLVNELAVFTVDDADGGINGIAPGSEGYSQAALANARPIFSNIADLPNGFETNNLSSLLEFESAQNLRFLLVKNSTVANVLNGITPIEDLLFSDAALQQITDLEDGRFSLAWKDSTGNTEDFKDLVVTIEATTEASPLGTAIQNQSGFEIIDLRDAIDLLVTPDETIQAEFRVYREAAYNNYVGFYQIDTVDGEITDPLTGEILTPGDADYSQVAVRNRVAGIDLSIANQSTATLTGEFTPGSLFAPFIIVNASPTEVLDANSGNDPAVYFAFIGANSDGVDHIRLLGNNVFGFEDLPNGGDLDYNDLIVSANLFVA